MNVDSHNKSQNGDSVGENWKKFMRLYIPCHFTTDILCFIGTIIAMTMDGRYNDEELSNCDDGDVIVHKISNYGLWTFLLTLFLLFLCGLPLCKYHSVINYFETHENLAYLYWFIVFGGVLAWSVCLGILFTNLLGGMGIISKQGNEAKECDVISDECTVIVVLLILPGVRAICGSIAILCLMFCSGDD
eukprot:553620_1